MCFLVSRAADTLARFVIISLFLDDLVHECSSWNHIKTKLRPVKYLVRLGNICKQGWRLLVLVDMDYHHIILGAQSRFYLRCISNTPIRRWVIWAWLLVKCERWCINWPTQSFILQNGFERHISLIQNCIWPKNHRLTHGVHCLWSGSELTILFILDLLNKVLNIFHLLVDRIPSLDLLETFHQCWVKQKLALKIWLEVGKESRLGIFVLVNQFRKIKETILI